ncbi:MAG: PRC-barrel domain protein [Oscillatoriales cyanobacterium SM2_2_1]|nr:PRC-barrel domain protein [Oscillatoriales cyanobacterium SM2_2_1]
MMPSDLLRQRANVLGLQVISKANGTRLGIITQMWLDMDQRQVAGFTVAERYIPGTPIGIGATFYMALERVDLLGPDALLVGNDAVLEDILVSERYTALIGDEVVTESGELLGRVRDFQFDSRTGEIQHLIIASVANPVVPAALISTYEVDVNEIIAVGRERIIVTEGMEDRLVQVTKGLLERLGLGKAPWEDEFEDDYFPSRTVSDNALGSGSRSGSYSPPPASRPVYRREEAWQEPEDNWSEERPAVRRRAPESRIESRPDPKPLIPPADDYDDLEPEEYTPRSRRYAEDAKQQIREAWGEPRVPEGGKQRYEEPLEEEL